MKDLGTASLLPRDSAPSRGARLVEGGAEFRLFSERAYGVELCLFDEAGHEQKIAMTPGEDAVWSAFVAGARAGQRYGFRVHGPYAPSEGDRFNPAKLVIDPYARGFVGKVDHWGPLVGGTTDAPDPKDSAPFVPKSVLLDASFDWGGDALPRVPWEHVVLYEAHVKGLTKLHPEVPEAHRGTYAGLAADAVIAHLRALGVTTIELLPIHEALDEAAVAHRGRTNAWGYSTLGYFAADQRFAADPRDPVRELKTAVKKLHAAGLEVVLDVVYNHTCEGDDRGPTVAFRGLDNRAYYRLEQDARARYADYTGCGNTLDATKSEVIRLVLDSLRYWVEEVHIDGFRFDLTPALGRGRDGGFDPEAPLIIALLQDPVLSRVKLIAEPWDVGPLGYQLGRFPAPFREWNAAYRDGMRRFWNGHTRSLADLGYRVSGSSDVFTARRGPLASVNFVTAHDGFTMRDLVSYEQKHNEANGENNQDGWSANSSTNFGVEGETRDPAILAARAKQVRNFFASLLLVPGVPMILAGDELSRTQRGNNNAYVIDDPTSWVDWTLTDASRELLDFVRGLTKLRAERPELRRTAFFSGQGDVIWLRPDGAEMVAADWSEPPSEAPPPPPPSEARPSARRPRRDSKRAIPKAQEARAKEPPPLALGVWMPGPRSLLLLVNGSPTPVKFRLPTARSAGWRVLVDTRTARGVEDAALGEGALHELAPRSLVLLETPPGG